MGDGLGVKAGADLAAILQLAVDPLAQRQRAEPAIGGGSGVAGDDEVADVERLGLGPGRGAARDIGRARRAWRRCLRARSRRRARRAPAPSPSHMIAVLDRRARRGVAGEQLREQQPCAVRAGRRGGPSRRGRGGRRRRTPACSPAPDESASCSAAKRVMPLSSRTTISPSITACLQPQRLKASGRVAVALGPVEAAAGEHGSGAAVDADQGAVAIELDLVQPVVAGGRLRRWGWRVAVPTPSGIGPATAPFSLAGSSLAARGFFGRNQLLDAAAGFDAFGARGEDIDARCRRTGRAP